MAKTGVRRKDRWCGAPAGRHSRKTAAVVGPRPTPWHEDASWSPERAPPWEGATETRATTRRKRDRAQETSPTLKTEECQMPNTDKQKRATPVPRDNGENAAKSIGQGLTLGATCSVAANRAHRDGEYQSHKLCARRLNKALANQETAGGSISCLRRCGSKAQTHTMCFMHYATERSTSKGEWRTTMTMLGRWPVCTQCYHATKWQNTVNV